MKPFSQLFGKGSPREGSLIRDPREKETWGSRKDEGLVYLSVLWQDAPREDDIHFAIMVLICSWKVRLATAPGNPRRTAALSSAATPTPDPVRDFRPINIHYLTRRRTPPHRTHLILSALHVLENKDSLAANWRGSREISPRLPQQTRQTFAANTTVT